MDYTNGIPYEILVNIFKLVSGSDRAASSQTCKRWYRAANDTCFLHKKCITITKIADEEPDESVLKLFETSDLPYSSYYFEDVEISNELNKFWDDVGANIRKLTFKDCKIPTKADLHVLSKCQNIELLEIEPPSDLFISGLLMDAGFEDGPSLNNLKTLSLRDSGNEISDAVLLRYFKAAPNLQDVDFSGCSISFNDVSGTLITASESTVTFEFLLAFLVERAQNLKRISFGSTDITDAALKCLSEVENLSLDILEVQSCFGSFTDAGILAVTSFQKNLRVLNIAKCHEVTDVSLISICHNLTNLEELNVSECEVTDLGVVELTQLKKLRVLNMSWCESVTSVGITNGICSNVNRTMNDLNISHLKLDQLCIINMSEKLPELRKLDVSGCFKAVTDTAIQAILKNQIWLRSLKLSGCYYISDEGLTGICGYKLFHSQFWSKTENEVVGDVNLVQENIPDDTISLARLKGLIDLNVNGCIHITDVILKYALKLKELVTLDLGSDSFSTSCRITNEGLKFLVNNCPAIETLKLNCCDQINDEGVDTIAKGLRRLRALYLCCCNQLTDKSLESIHSHSKCLQVLDVGSCWNLSTDLALSLKTHIKTLRTVDT